LSLFLSSGIYLIPDEKVVALRRALMEFGPLRKLTSEDLGEIRDILITSFSENSEMTLEEENVLLKRRLQEKEDSAQYITRQVQGIEESAMLRSRDVNFQFSTTRFSIDMVNSR
jgi:regulator of replication initiation timing